MWLASKPLSERQRRRGFTIVELLIVIAVIGILAAITIITFNGVEKRASLAVLQSDLANAATQLGTDNAVNGSYPATAAASNNGAGLKASPGTTYQYTYSSSSNSYCLTGTNSGVAYMVSSSSSVSTPGVCPGDFAPGTQVITLAGSTSGYTNGTGSAAQFFNPYGVAVDASGNVYVADTGNNVIRKITSGGVVTTLAGSGAAGFTNGTGSSAQFRNPGGLAVDSSGNIYVADINNSAIREISPSGNVTTLAGTGVPGYADGTGTSAHFSYPYAVAVDSSGNVYVADSSNQRIRKITAGGVVTTLAGSGANASTDGTGAGASFSYPYAIAVDSAGNLYVADWSGNKIRKVSSMGVVSTIAGSGVAGYADGTGTSAQFSNPDGIAVDSSGDVYVSDGSNQRLREISTSGVVTTHAGNGTYGYVDSTLTASEFEAPYGLSIGPSGNIYLADTNNNRIRVIQP